MVGLMILKFFVSLIINFYFIRFSPKKTLTFRSTNQNCGFFIIIKDTKILATIEIVCYN